MLGLPCLIDGAFCALKSSYLNSNSIAIALSRFKKRFGKSACPSLGST